MQETVHNDPAVNWLLQSDDPSIRYLTLTEVLGKSQDSPEVESAGKQIPQGPKVQLLLSGQMTDGGFGVHPYQKWTGAHWRLVSLVELGIPSGFRPAVKATDLVLKWLLGEAHLGNVPKINGRYRRCASQEGNALAVCSRLGLAEDPRVVKLAESLSDWHCDILQELMMLSRAGKLDDPRTKEAMDIVEKKRGRDGLWYADDYYWSVRRTPLTRSKVLVSNIEVVDWGRKGPNKMITLNALRTLKASGRIKL